ncbi:MAG: TRAP transporter fused permease subunit [Candidatus Tectomicrobia bacterium]|nr:TRAP transporter fused permease subunit [Candidatus Tectomicrobia bacterium]
MANTPVSQAEDQEGRSAHGSGWASRFVASVLVFASLFHLYVAGYAAISAMSLRTLHWTLMSVPLFLLYRSRRGSRRASPTVVDLLWAAVSAVSGLYIFRIWPDKMFLLEGVARTDFWMGLFMIILVLEAARRVLGTLLPLVSLVFLLYAYFGPYMPGWLAHKGYDLERIIEELYITTGGIYGIPIAVSSTYIIVFVLFGAFLQGSGGGQLFIDLAHSVAGRFRGGPAKTAVLSSALMGMISGSPVGNVVTTGTFTIPLMKRTGYTPLMAGAVEACASTGGMFTPPIMGAAAFIIAEFMGVPYLRIILAAAIPAYLFYLAVLLFVDIEAVKKGLRGLPREELPSVKSALAGRGHLLIPIIALIGMLVVGYSPMKSAFWSILLLFVLSLLRVETRMGLREVIQSLDAGARNTLPVAAACACAGIIVGVVGLTGVGVKFSSVLLRTTEQASAIIPHLKALGLSAASAASAAAFLASLLALVLGAVAALILGAGIPPTAVYIVMASLAIPAIAATLEAVHVATPELAAHFFAFHFATIGAITPPVALAAYAAAGISGADPFKTGLTAFRIGLIAYIVPFMFAYSPSLLFEGSWPAILQAVVTATVGVMCITASTQGFLIQPLRLWSRPFFLIAGLLLVKPGPWTDLAGVSLGAVLFLFGRRPEGRSGPAVASKQEAIASQPSPSP